MDAPTKSVVYGDELTVTGTLRRGDGSGIAGQRVLVQKQGTSGWVTVARTETNGDGAWSVPVTWRAAGKVRARATVTGSGTSATGGVQVGCTPLLTAKAADDTRQGRPLAERVAGSIHPVAPVSVKVEQQGKDGKWRTIRTQKLRPQAGAVHRARAADASRASTALTPHTGSGRAKASAAALYVRAVRKSSSLSSGSGGTKA